MCKNPRARAKKGQYWKHHTGRRGENPKASPALQCGGNPNHCAEQILSPQEPKIYRKCERPQCFPYRSLERQNCERRSFPVCFPPGTPDTAILPQGEHQRSQIESSRSRTGLAGRLPERRIMTILSTSSRVKFPVIIPCWLIVALMLGAD